MSIESALQSVLPDLLRLPNVVGVGIGEKHGRQVIKILVGRKFPETELAGEKDIVPKDIQGYPTDVVEIGMPAAQDLDEREG